MKKFLYIFLLIVIVAVWVVVFRYYQREEPAPRTDNKILLTPATAITHGHGLAVDVSDPRTVYIATHHGLLVLKNDTDLYHVGQALDDYMGFSVHPSHANIFFASGHPGTGGNIGFQKTEDAGQTWSTVSSGSGGPVDFHAMAVSPANPNFVFGWFRGDLHASTDGGNTWQTTPMNFVPVHLAAHPTDQNKLYAATSQGQGVMVSSDQGKTWSVLSQDLQGTSVAALAIDPQNSQHMLSSSEKFGLGVSYDSGATWQKVNATFEGDIMFFAFSKPEPGVVYALTHTNKLYKSTDSGQSWSLIR